MQRILVLGAGFAGLWSALGAARKLDESGIGADRVQVALADRSAWHAIRVRNYEADLTSVRVPLDDVLGPAGVQRIAGEVVDIDVASRLVRLRDAPEPLAYDRLVMALGSRLVRPPVPGFSDYVFDIDTYDGALRLDAHLASLSARPRSAARDTVLVIGAGLAGIELATELPSRLAALGSARVILADRRPWIGSDMGEPARAVIDRALSDLGIEARPGVTVASVDAGGATFDGERIDAATVIWCGGVRAHPLTARFPVALDRAGRLPVDAFLRIEGRRNEFAAGDVAWLTIDGVHASVMSCQHARPMGRFAGYNAACDLLGEPMLPLHIDWYVTVLDLGAWGAVYTEGWDRRVAAQGEAAKRTKHIINCERIYPPRTGDRRAILDAAAPVVQRPPLLLH
jgi:NADH dehydrogenase